MRTIYIDRRDAELDVEGAALVVRVAGERVQSLPLGPIERLVVRSPAMVATRLLAELWQRDVGLLVLSGRRGEPTGRFVGRPHADVLVRCAQVRLTEDAPRRDALAARLVRAKVAAQRRLVRRWLGAGLGERRLLLEVERRLAAHGRTLRRPEAASRATVSGLEGAATAAFFEAYRTLFAPALGFRERNRRPPRDPVNAVLSLGYTLLHHEAVRVAQIRGLDPCIGVLHAPLAGRESLACDLIEPLRARVDDLVASLFRDATLRPESFTTDGTACLLGKAGRERFYAAWEATAPALRRQLDSLCRLLVRVLRAEAAPAAGAAS
jgi:CRISPR-associated protein Cas1